MTTIILLQLSRVTIDPGLHNLRKLNTDKTTKAKEKIKITIYFTIICVEKETAIEEKVQTLETRNSELVSDVNGLKGIIFTLRKF